MFSEKGYTHDFEEFVIFRSCQFTGVLQIRFQILDGAVHLFQRLLNRIQGDSRCPIDVNQLFVEGKQIGELCLDRVHQVMKQRRLILRVFRVGKLRTSNAVNKSVR